MWRGFTLQFCGMLAIGIAIAGINPIHLFGQVETSVAAREQLYNELASEVEALEKQGNVLKRVVKLATPTVVHIVAEHDDVEGRLKPKPIEDAGSGVIIRWNNQFYVLTN